MLPENILSVCCMTKVLIIPHIVQDQHIFSVPHSNLQNITVNNKLSKQVCSGDAWTLYRSAALIFFLSWHDSTMPTLAPFRGVTIWILTWLWLLVSTRQLTHLPSQQMLLAAFLIVLGQVF